MFCSLCTILGKMASLNGEVVSEWEVVAEWVNWISVHGMENILSKYRNVSFLFATNTQSHWELVNLLQGMKFI